MARLIVPEDIKKVRDRAALDDIVEEFVTLRRSGSGSYVGLCPFHDEKTPSFNVRPSVGMWHCFGCGEGGDVISFIQEIEHLSFVDAVEWIANRVGIQLRYTEEADNGEDRSARRRALDMHKVAAEFYSEQLFGPPARPARDFLRGKKFDGDAARLFGVGYAPQSWDGLLSHLKSQGFEREDVVAAGLATRNDAGRIYDRFRGRVMWPIADITGAVIGFGARKLFDDDKGPKYLNTPETALYHKSGVLYGLNLAKKHIAKADRVVVVEGYTDVMACHLAGEQTAVATCGTAFGADHAKLVSRMLTADRMMTGEVIFTFDGDAAGQKAALRAYELDEQFMARTMVAVGPNGLDPCDVRIQMGDAAITTMIERREPLYQMVVNARLDRWDLKTVEGRVQGLRDIAPVLADIRGEGARNGYARQVATRLATPEAEVFAAVEQARLDSARQAKRRATMEATSATHVANKAQPPAANEASSAHQNEASASVDTPDRGRPQPRPVRGSLLERAIRKERELLKLLVQYPQVASLALMGELEGSTFAVERHRDVFEILEEAGLRDAPQGGTTWTQQVMDATPHDMKQAMSWFAMKEIPAKVEDPEEFTRYATECIAGVVRSALERHKQELRQAAAAVSPGNLAELEAIGQEVKIVDAMIHELLPDV